jgi:hypothetical protein
MTTLQQFDQQRAEAFAERMLGVLNEAAVALMTSIGHRTGLFDAMAGLPPSTSEQVAAAADLNERYVREWLGAMTVGGLVEQDPEAGTYYLPAEHAAFLTRAASPDNLAVVAHYIPLMGSVEDGIVESFRNGGGLPYSAFPRFHEVMAEDSAQTVVAALIDHILPLVPGLTGHLKEGIDVLDVGCGSRRALNLLAREFPNSRFTGYDLSEEAIGRARAETEEHGTTQRPLRGQGRGHPRRESCLRPRHHLRRCPRSGKAGGGARRDSRSPQGRRRVPDAGYRRLQPRPQGHGPSHSSAPVRRLDHPLHDGLPGAGWRGPGHDVGRGKAREMLRGAGFREVEVRQLPHDFANNYYIVRKG